MSKREEKNTQPEEDRPVIREDWVEAIRKMLRKPEPPEGWPKPKEPVESESPAILLCAKYSLPSGTHVIAALGIACESFAIVLSGPAGADLAT